MICAIPKLFPYGEFLHRMKLTRTKLLETIRRKNEGWTTYQARKIAGISIRRVNQVYGEFNHTGKVPEIGKAAGRPKRYATKAEKRMVVEAYKKYRVSASTLEKLIERDYKVHIPHNHIHKILLNEKIARKMKKIILRKKAWIRYERRHSLTAVHIDWYYFSKAQTWVFAVIDDASRKMLALIETHSPTTEASIEGMMLALKHGKIGQCISDHGSQFISNVGGDSKFKAFLEENGIKQILCKIKHPQSNGKVERWFQTYHEHREAFDSKNKFLTWYNDIRPHRSLNFEVLETPQQAFIRKMKAEA